MVVSNIFFTPKIGKDFQFDSYFSDGLVQPPTRLCLLECVLNRFDHSIIHPPKTQLYNIIVIIGGFGVRWFGFLGFLMKGIVSQTTNYPNQHPNNQLFQIFIYIYHININQMYRQVYIPVPWIPMGCLCFVHSPLRSKRDDSPGSIRMY